MTIKLTPKRCKEICSDFELATLENGKKGCKHKLDEDLCRHPAHFLCELKKFRSYVDAKTEREGVEAWSPSRIKVFETCPRLYAFHYEERVRDGDEPDYFAVGTAFSNGRARIDMGEKFDPAKHVPISLKPHLRCLVNAALRFYEKNPPYPATSVDKCEEFIHFRYPNTDDGTWYMGFLDALRNKRAVISEWKFAQQPYGGIEAARQAAVYFEGVPEAQFFELWTMKKPKLKPKKQEPLKLYEERIYNWFVEHGPNEIYRRVVFQRDQIHHRMILKEMTSQTKTKPIVKQEGYPAAYGINCSRCGFKDACEKNLGHSTLVVAGLLRTKMNGGTPKTSTAGPKEHEKGPQHVAQDLPPMEPWDPDNDAFDETLSAAEGGQ